jgi:hypothetical protein
MKNGRSGGVATWLNKLFRRLSEVRPHSGSDLVPIPVARSAEDELARRRLLARTWHPRPP